VDKDVYNSSFIHIFSVKLPFFGFFLVYNSTAGIVDMQVFSTITRLLFTNIFDPCGYFPARGVGIFFP